MDCMKQLLREFESVVSYAGPKGHELIDLLTSSKSTLSLFFREFYDEISKADSSKQQVLSADGTVHEVTSNVSANSFSILQKNEPANMSMDLFFVDIQLFETSPRIPRYCTNHARIHG